MSSAQLLPIVLGLTAIAAVVQAFILRADRARRAQGRKPLGSGPWFGPAFLAVAVVGLLVFA